MLSRAGLVKHQLYTGDTQTPVNFVTCPSLQIIACFLLTRLMILVKLWVDAHGHYFLCH